MSKDINELVLPDNVRYTDDHEWCKQEGDKINVGITDYAQDQLGDIVFVELPEVGDTFEQKEVFGSLESVKAVSEMYMPVGGEIVSINEQIEDAPEFVNEDPYEKGWIIKVKQSDPTEFDSLMTQEAYLETLKGSE